MRKFLKRLFSKSSITVSGQNSDGEFIHYTKKFYGSIDSKWIEKVGKEAGIVSCLNLDKVSNGN